MPLPVVAVALHIEPVMRTTQEFRWTLVALLAGTSLLGAAPRADAQDTTPSPGDHALTAESVMAPLQRSIAWYQDARLAMQSIRGVLDGDFDRAEEETARRALQRAFDTARARAAVLAQEEQTERPGAPPRPARVKRRAELEAAIEHGERDVARLKGRLGTAAAAARPAVLRLSYAISAILPQNARSRTRRSRVQDRNPCFSRGSRSRQVFGSVALRCYPEGPTRPKPAAKVS
jgi:hypothetical protein